MSNNAKIILAGILAVVLVAVSFGVGYLTAAVNRSQSGLGVAEEAWEIVFREYVDNDQLDSDVLAGGAVEGMMTALDDPYSTYLDIEAYQLTLQSMAGQFEGIGATVNMEDDQVVIVAPMEGSPAEAAGIRAGDIILEVDGLSTEGMSLTELVVRVKGPEGTTVSLLVLHEGETEPELIEIVRAIIELPSVSFEMKDDIAYIAITDFTERTAEELVPVMAEVEQQASGIILDLRDNLGGPLDALLDVASFFLEDGLEIIDIVDNQGNHDVYYVSDDNETSDLPLVVLVNGYSASASEALTGALQDYERATIAGAVTLGKGSANNLFQLEDGSGIYVTVARWLTPNGRMIEGEGIYPDYELDLENVDAVQWAVDYLRSRSQ